MPLLISTESHWNLKKKDRSEMMKVHTSDKNKSQSVANEISRNKSSNQSAAPFLDNRSEAVAQRKLRRILSNRPHARQMRAFQEMANHGLKTEQSVESDRNISVIQAKKTGPIDLPRKLAARFDINYSQYKDLDDDAYKAFMYANIQATYNESLAKGTRYWNRFQDALAQYNGEGREELVSGLAEKRKEYKVRFKSNYVNKTKKIGTSKNQDVATSGLGFDGDKVDPTKDIPYSNSADFRDNSITALHNYAERDMAREADVALGGAEDYERRGLPNSEILWQQYKLAAKKQFKYNKGSRAKKLMKGLSVVKRRQVQPVETIKTIMFAMPDNKIGLEVKHTWTAGTEEFLAMLGTPNCSGVVHMLADHIDELEGKSITEIELLGDKDVNLDIRLG